MCVCVVSVDVRDGYNNNFNYRSNLELLSHNAVLMCLVLCDDFLLIPPSGGTVVTCVHKFWLSFCAEQIFSSISSIIFLEIPLAFCIFNSFVYLV